MLDLLPLAIVNGFLVGGVYGLTAVGLTLIFGVMGVANFAQGVFVMAGMYLSPSPRGASGVRGRPKPQGRREPCSTP